MTDLNPQDQAIVDLARDGCEPTESDRRRMRIALAAQLGLGAGLTSTTAGGTMTVGGVAAHLGAIKIIGAVLLGAGLGLARCADPAPGGR